MRDRDPLDYAIADEPVPADLTDDEEFTAEYDKARDDLDLLRRGLGELASLTPPAASVDRTKESPPARTSFARNPGRILLAAAAVVLVLVGGTFVIRTTGGGQGSPTSAERASRAKAAAPESQSGADQGAGKKLEPKLANPSASPGATTYSKPGNKTEDSARQRLSASALSCAKVVAVGHVTSTQRIAGDRAIVEFSVTRQVLPLAANPQPLKFEVADPLPWRVDREALVMLDKSPVLEPTVVWMDTNSGLATDYEKAAQGAIAPCPR